MSLPNPLPDNPLRWEGWKLYNSANFYERLGLSLDSNASNDQIEDHCRQLLVWWQKKLPLKNQPSNPLAQVLRSGLDEAPVYLVEARTVLLDPEARGARKIDREYGRMREPVLLWMAMIRALDVTTDGAMPQSQLWGGGQNLFEAETVFNYYPADYVIPGTSLAGPQFGIFNASTYFPRANFMYNLSLGASCPAATPNLCGPNNGNADATVALSTGTRVDYGQLTPFANNTTNLIEQVNNMLLFGTMPPGMKLAIKTAIDIPALGGPTGPYTATQLRDRARTAVYLVTVSLMSELPGSHEPLAGERHRTRPTSYNTKVTSTLVVDIC